MVIADVADAAHALKQLDAGDAVHAVRADVAVFADCEAMVDATRRQFGALHVLVNNAAVFATLRPQPFDAIAEAEWDRVMAVNVKGIWNCVRAGGAADAGAGRRADHQRRLGHRPQGHGRTCCTT